MKRLLSALTGAVMMVSSFPAVISSSAAANDDIGRQVEFLSRGLIAAKVDNGVYLSWRLLGAESMEQKFDVYKNGELIKSEIDSVNYTDNEGFSYDKYQVVPSGTLAEDIDKNCLETEVWTKKDGGVTYCDIPLNKPESSTAYDGSSYTYSVNDVSVADLDGDGELEYIIKWDPSNSQDNSIRGYTGRVLIDAYELDGTHMWRIDLGDNIRAGAHYTQFIVYDFDGDGKAEMAVKTAPGSKDGQGNYVNSVNFSGTYDDNSKKYVTTKTGKSQGMIITGEEYLTMFEGETGRALKTIDYVPERGSVRDWGDSYGSRSERYLAAVAYLNGNTPSLIMCRGYYERAAMVAYDWDGANFKQLWIRDDKSGGLKGEGNHNISVCDADNDGKDEVVFGSAVVDDDGQILHRTGRGHGDALHVSDFNNDGCQEIFQVHESTDVAQTYGAEVRNAQTGEVLGKYGRKTDVGRGCMDNIDDDFALQNPNALSMFWCSASTNVFDISGNTIKKTIVADGQETTVDVMAPGDTNFFIYWDGDLSRELLDRNRIDKFTVENGTQRLATFSGIHSNNGSKSTPALCADIFGDWREEVLFGTADDTALRIYMTTDETEYKLTTLLHDTQYRTSVAWQNVGYNQPTHLSYYVGKSSLASGKNYLAPNTDFDDVYTTDAVEQEVNRELKESIIYTSNSFNNGFDGGFSNVSVMSEKYPYNNVIKTTGTSTLNLRYLFDNDATPAPTLSPTPTATMTPTPVPTAKPVYENDFSGETEGIITFVKTEDQEPYTSIAGMEIHIGTRSDGADATTYAAIATNGNPANCLEIHSGRFSNANRGARVKLLTPEYGKNDEVIAVLDFKAEEGNALYYSDKVSEQGTNVLGTGDNAWHTLKITISGGTRKFYVDGIEITKDNGTQLPVLWGTGNMTYSSVFFDNYSVRVEQVPVTALRVEAVYNDDGTLKSIADIRYDAEVREETPDKFRKVFYWDSIDNMKPIAVYSGDFSDEKTIETMSLTEHETHDKMGTYKVSFDWKPGSTVEFKDETGANIVTLSKSGSSSMTYKAGTNAAKPIHSSLVGSTSWYHAELTIDFTAKNLDISVMDYTNNTPTKTVYAVPFTGVNGYLAEMTVSNGAYIDNVRISEIKYNVPMTLFNFNISNQEGEPLENVDVKIGSKSLTTDASGHTAIKLKQDTYSYLATKAEYKSESGTITAAGDVENIDVELKDGEMRNIYITYKFGDVVIKQTSEPVAQAKENTKYTVSDSVKADDITYTFTSDADEITPGYEEYMGKTYTFEYDADLSSTVDIMVAEDADTYITLAYKIKLVPTLSDTEILDINFGEDGYGKTNWSASSFDYSIDETYGTKYAQFTGLNNNNIVVNIPDYTSDNLVVEFDISFRSLTYGGNYYGVTPYSGTKAGQGFGIRTSRAENTQWQWCYRAGNDIYMQNAVDGKEYSYSYNWQNRWAHVVMVAVPSMNKFNVSVVNKDTGVVFLKDAQLPFANGVGSSSGHVTKLVFGRAGYGNMSPDDVIGLANLKAYTIGGNTGAAEELSIDIHDGMSVDLASNYHASDYAGLEYSVDDVFNVTYELQSEDGTAVSAEGVDVSSEGVLTIAKGVSLKDMPQYYVAVKYNGQTAKRIKLNYLESVLVYGTIKGFDSGETSPFTLTNKSGFNISNSNGTMMYTRAKSTGLDSGVWLSATVWDGKLSNDFVFSYDMMVEESFYKGYLYLRDNVGNVLVKGETHFDEPRIKFFAPNVSGPNTPSFASGTFEKGKWYTFVFRGTGFDTEEKFVTLEIYNKGDYDYKTDTASSDTVISPIDFTPVAGCTNNGLTLNFQTAQGNGKQQTDNGDKHYFDNLAYYYYEYK